MNRNIRRKSKTNPENIEVGDTVRCCITGTICEATEEIVDEIISGDPDWELVLKRDV